MKAIDIAKKKQISMDELSGVCRDLGISCSGEDSEIGGNDVFLVEKRIQTRNEEKARDAIGIPDEESMTVIDVAIVGGGNSALEAADFLMSIARKIYVINNPLFKPDLLIDILKPQIVTVQATVPCYHNF